MSDLIEHEIVNHALQEILSSKKFSASPQMSAFLSYVVEETLKGNSSRIKAYTIAIDGLSKPDSFDPQRDPSVRVLAKRLRDSLDAYYAENSNPNLTIKLKPGSYIPHFIQPEPNLPAVTPGIEQMPNYAITLPEQSASPDLPASISSEPQTPTLIADEGISQAETPRVANQKWRKTAAIGTAILLSALFIAHEQNTQLAAPVVYMSAMSNERSLVSHLSNSISNKMIENGAIEVKRVLPAKDKSDLNAKDYQLLLSSMETVALDGISERTQVDIQLIQAKTGRIVDSKSFKLNTNPTYKISDINAIENYANSLAHANGPLNIDYHAQANKKSSIQK